MKCATAPLPPIPKSARRILKSHQRLLRNIGSPAEYWLQVHESGTFVKVRRRRLVSLRLKGSPQYCYSRLGWLCLSSASCNSFLACW
jgi:hypothetical protein